PWIPICSNLQVVGSRSVLLALYQNLIVNYPITIILIEMPTICKQSKDEQEEDDLPNSSLCSFRSVPPRALLVVVQGYTCIGEGGTWEGTLPWRLRSKCTPSVEFRMHSEENRHTPIPPTLLTSNSILPQPSPFDIEKYSDLIVTKKQSPRRSVKHRQKSVDVSDSIAVAATYGFQCTKPAVQSSRRWTTDGDDDDRLCTSVTNGRW
ncbi:hypothetical protein V1477_015456, partial [Vespula maculifrons]